MKAASALICTVTLMALSEASAADEENTPIPASCPVTRATPENRFTPPPPARPSDQHSERFWYGSDSLYTELFSDGRWRGIKSPTGSRDKSFWYRKDAQWLNENPYELKVTYRQLSAAEPMFTASGVTNAILRKQVAMLLMLELPTRGCWEVTGSYKNAHVSFVTWVD
jgi:hypothetical protein